MWGIINISGVMFNNFTPKHLAIDMRINLSGDDRLVSQHALYNSQISTAFKEMGRKRVTKGVGTDGLSDAGHFSQLFNQMEDHDPR